jgi:hypothetical protein
MKCSCIINDNYNFIIEYKKDYLLFIDKSEWRTEAHNKPIEEFDLVITNSKNDSKLFKARVNGTTMIKYSELPCETDCKYDGIYTFNVNNCGQDYQITEAIINNIMCSYSKLIVDTKLEDFQTKVIPILYQIEAIKASTRFNLISKAKEHMSVLERMFKNLNCKC